MSHCAICRTFGSNLKWTLVLFLLIGLRLNAQAPPWVRAGSFGGPGSDFRPGVKVTETGEGLVTGSFSSTAQFGKKVLVSAGDSDIFLDKHGRFGTRRWIVQAGGSGHDEGTDIALDGAGNAYVTGWFTDSATFASTDGSSKTVTGVGETVFLAKYRSSGVLAWIQTGTVGSIFVNRGHGVAIEPTSGSLYITGVSQGSTTFSSSDGSANTVPGPGTWHMFLVKYDTDGNFKWGEWNQASPNTVPEKVGVDSDASAYVTGWFEAQATFHSHDGQDQTVTGLSQPVQTPPDYPDDSFVAKYDSSGNLKWVNDIGGYKAITTDIAISSDGEVSLTGFIGNIGSGTTLQGETIVTSQPPGSKINLGGGQFTHPYNKDAVIATYDANGVLLKASRIGAAKNDGGSGIAYDQAGNLYLSGVFAGTINVAGHLLRGTKTHNLFVLKYGIDGLVWAKKANGAGTEQFESGNPRLSVIPGGGVLVTGAYLDTAVFGDITLQSAGAEDIFLALVGR